MEIKNVIQLKEVIKTVGKQQIIKKISFDVPFNNFCAFIGPSGAGKTTVIKSILNLYSINSGNILLSNQNWKRIATHQIIGYVPEKENFPRITALTFLMQIAYIYNMDKIKAKNEIEKYAKIFSLFDDLNKKLTSMSSGQRKRVMIISALIHNPQILIMDEPTENLDPDNRKVFYDVLKKFISDGKTIFISTHNLDEIEKHIDYAIIISNGEIKYQGTVKKGYGELTKIYEKYKN